MINRDIDAHYFRMRIDADYTSIIEMGVVNPVEDRRIHPKSLGSVEFEMIDKVVNENFTIEVWTPKKSQILSDEFFTTILYDSKEYMKISADSPTLWLDIVNSYKSKDTSPDLSAQNH